MRFQRILSIVLVLLLLTSMTIPAASAGEVAPVVVIPATAELLVDGAFITIVGSGVIFLADQFGKRWDETKEGWDQLLKFLGEELTKVVHTGKMIPAESPRGEAILAFDYYTAGAGDKKPGKVYHKAELKNGKVKIDPQRISEDEAVKELRNGRDIFAPNQELSYKVAERASEENYAKLKKKHPKKHPNIERFIKIDAEENLDEENLELHGSEKEIGYYDHYHPKYQNTRPHCWMWWK